VGLPPIVREFCERDGVERPRRKVNAHRDFGFPLGQDVVGTFAERCFVLARTSPPCSSW
jgi:hypothetical protein